jgi:hypothetical protein
MGKNMPETCWDIDKQENKKYCNVTSCWYLFTTWSMMHGTQNIKFSEIRSSMYVGLHVKHLLLVRFQWNLNFLDGFRQIFKQNFMKLCPVEAKLFRADRRTDRQTRPSSQSLLEIFSTDLKIKRCSVNILRADETTRSTPGLFNWHSGNIWMSGTH